MVSVFEEKSMPSFTVYNVVSLAGPAYVRTESAKRGMDKEQGVSKSNDIPVVDL